MRVGTQPLTQLLAIMHIFVGSMPISRPLWEGFMALLLVSANTGLLHKLPKQLLLYH